MKNIDKIISALSKDENFKALVAEHTEETEEKSKLRLIDLLAKGGLIEAWDILESFEGYSWYPFGEINKNGITKEGRSAAWRHYRLHPLNWYEWKGQADKPPLDDKVIVLVALGNEEYVTGTVRSLLWGITRDDGNIRSFMILDGFDFDRIYDVEKGE